MIPIPDAWPTPILAATIEANRPFFQSRHVLVTGAFGFVGGHLTRALHESGAEVTALDRDTSSERGALLNLTGLRETVTVVEADVTNRSQLQEIIAHGDYDFIFHLAAAAPTVDKALYDPYDIVQTNTLGFVHIAEAVRHLPFAKRPVILLASTDKVYGDARHEKPNSTYQEDEVTKHSLGIYDAAKLSAEIVATTYRHALGVPTIVLRLCNLFGPYDFNYNLRLIPKALCNIFRDEEAPDLYFNAMEHYRDYLYIDDAIRALLLLARHEKCRGGVYNLPGIRYAATPDILREVIDLVGDLQGEAKARNTADPFARLRWNHSIHIAKSDPRPAIGFKPRMDGRRLYEEIGFEPEVVYRTALSHTIFYYYWYFTQIAPGPPHAPLSKDKAAAEPPVVVSAPAIAFQVVKPQALDQDKSPATTSGQASSTPAPLYETLGPRQPLSFIQEEEEAEETIEETPSPDETPQTGERQPYVTVYKLDERN